MGKPQDPLSVAQGNQVIVVDFFDSFTYNIVSELYSLGLSCKVVSHDRLQATLKRLKKVEDRVVVIYGPGPGTPHTYPEAISFYQSLCDHPHIFHLGVCLGHQLIWSAHNFKIKRSEKPIHGGSIAVTIPKWNCYAHSEWGRVVRVQRYNSLIVACKASESFHFNDGECQIGRRFQTLTYQFHPESVGTSYPKLFFKPVVDFLYNETDG